MSSPLSHDAHIGAYQKRIAIGAYHRAWRADKLQDPAYRHKELERQRAYRAANPEIVREQWARSQAKHRRPRLHNAHVRKFRELLRARLYKRAWVKSRPPEWHARRAEKYNKWQRVTRTTEGRRSEYGPARTRLATRRAFIDWLKTQPCMDCGGRFPSYAMDFDHRRGVKRSNISLMWQSISKWDEFSAEIVKCDLVCSNCHRHRTWGDHKMSRAS